VAILQANIFSRLGFHRAGCLYGVRAGDAHHLSPVRRVFSYVPGALKRRMERQAPSSLSGIRTTDRAEGR